MAFKYTGDATLGVGLTVETPKPLDNRTVVDNLEELYSIPEKYAYQGMTVSNIDNGNIYMLIDKSKIKYKEGWKASYESIQIIACTEAEYKEWSANTTEDFKPKDENKTYLHAETYYYIYEDSLNDNQFYLSAEWGKGIEERLNQKALNTTVTQIRNDLDQTVENLSKYATLEELTANYAPKTDLDLEDPESPLSKALSNRYTKQETNDIFVTKESLRGDSSETGDDFIFVTQNKYQQDQTAASQEFNTKLLKSEQIETSDIIIQKIVEKEVQQGTTGEDPEDIVTEQTIESSINLTTEDNRLLVSGKQVAVTEEVPKLVCLPQTDYDGLVENNKTENDTYYCTYGEKDIQDTGYVRSEYLTERYYTKAEVDALIGVDPDPLKNYATKEELVVGLAEKQPKGDYALASDIPSLAGYATEQWVASQINNAIDGLSAEIVSINDLVGTEGGIA